MHRFKVAPPMTIGPAHEIRLGELLLRLGLVNEEQLRQAILVQRQLKEYKPIGEVLRELGFFSRTLLRDILNKYRKHIRLGKLLLRMDALSEAELTRGLKAQQRKSGRLGEILVKEFTISRSVLAHALSIQLTIPVIQPDLRLFDRNLLEELNAHFFYHKQVVPVARNAAEDALTVIMDDPLDMETVMILEKTFNHRIEPAVLLYGRIDHILDVLLDPWAKPLENDPPETPAVPGPRGAWKIS